MEREEDLQLIEARELWLSGGEGVFGFWYSAVVPELSKRDEESQQEKGWESPRICV